MKKTLAAALVATFTLFGACATTSYDWRDWHCNQKKCDDKQKEKWCANMCEQPSNLVDKASECTKFQDPAEETCKQYMKPATTTVAPAGTDPAPAN